MARILAGLRVYQQAPRPAAPALPPIITRHGRAALHDYGGAGAPVVFVPSLINPPRVLDLAVENSLLRHLSARGHRILLVNWGGPEPAERALDIAGHVEALLLPLLAALGRRPALVGYCLGGTMALAAAANIACRGVATLAAPWRFAGFPDAAREGLRAMFAHAQPAAEQMGLLPMEVLQTGFWRLDPARTVGKFERLAGIDALDPALADFVRLEDWANDGPPLTLAAGRDLVDRFMAADEPGSGRWRVGGHRIDPHVLPCPLLDIVSTTDRIVPSATAHGAGDRITLGLGHVGMIIGGRAPERVWAPLDAWLSGLDAGC
ncbi:alpha/beta fold hydrolase [Sphingomonas sp. 1P06PA]|uniref:alpha/beta fold hydrolase n=1 Tax=Sphingomonas sp. 1P06PA TaxID=554121 RepID=UPI0039A461A5